MSETSYQKDNQSFIFRKIFLLLFILAGLMSFFKEVYVTTELTVSPDTSKVLGIQGASDIREAELVNIKELPINNIENEFKLKIPVLMYHYIRGNVPMTDNMPYYLSVKPEELDKQFAWLKENDYQTISLNDLVNSLENQEPLPPKSVVITFDDGYRDFYTTAFPIIKKYNFRVVSFYVVGYLNYPGYMDLSMLKEIHNSGLVDIESHTIGHLMLTSLPPEVAKAEIFDSKALLEKSLNKKINFLAYPYGDFNEAIVNNVREAGYKLAFSTNPGVELKLSERYFLRRIAISGYDTLNTFKGKITN